MKKILISTKMGFNSSSDCVGGSLFQILLAEYMSKNLNYKVFLHDPFYNSKKEINNCCDIIENLNFEDLDNFDRIVDPLFYVSSLTNKKTNKITHIEGKSNWHKFIFDKKKNISLIQSRNINSLFDLKKSNIFKSFYVPYVYYYDLFAREKFESKINLKKNIKIPFIKNKINVGLHLRKLNVAKRFRDNLEGKDYLDFINKFIKILNQKFNNPNIITYGSNDKNEFLEYFNHKKEKNIFRIEDFSENPLVTSILLSNHINILFSTINGYSQFFTYLALSKNNLKKKFIINSEENIKEVINSRRALRLGIQENNFGYNSAFYGKWEFLKNKDILEKNFSIEPSVIDTPKSKTKKLFVYDVNDYEDLYFNKKFEKIIFDKHVKELKKIFKNRTILKLSKKNSLKKIKKEDIVNNLHLVSHCNLSKIKDASMMGFGSIDFVKHDYLSNFQKKYRLNSSNFFFDDLYSFFIRQIKNKNLKIKKIKPKKIIMVLDNNIMKNERQFNFWKKIKFQAKNTEKTEINFISYDYKKNKILLFEKKFTNFNFTEKFIINHINTYDIIITTTDEFSLMMRFISDKNNIILFSENINKKLICENKTLFSNSIGIDHASCYAMSFNLLHELWLYLFNKYKKNF